MSDVIDRLNAALESRYRIESELGEGGMATVFLAHDIKHDRKVALKVLKPELAAVVGGERFLAEIRTTANLQHPNILPLFDSGEADTFLYYVMPYIEGESLREKLQREKQLHVDEAVGVATEVAEALQAAHEQGIIHRDIKPANILLSAGRPLVADFGIALAVTQAGGERITETGLSLGTPYYMSPEQATGDRVPTAASDVYGLGCVLYEMLTGEPPHTGSTAQAVLGKILLGSPTRATELRPSVPAHIDGALLKALEKLPADRFESAADFARALRNPSFRYGDSASVEAGRATGPWKGLALGAAAAAAVLGGGLVWALTRPSPEPPVTRQVLEPFAQGASYDRPLGALTALAPDGSSMVFAEATEGNWYLVLKRRGSAETLPLPGTEQARVPVYSPDGLEIAWVSGQELKKRPVEGGAVLTLARDADQGMAGVSWADNGTILYERDADNALMQIPATGGEPRVVRSTTGGDTLIAWTHALPGSEAALVEICPTGNCASGQLLTVIDLGTGEMSVLADEILRAWWVRGHIVYVRRDGTVWAAPFDLNSRAFTGAAVPLFENVATGLSFPEMVLGADGTLIYIEGEASAGDMGGRELIWVNREGEPRLVDPAMDAGVFQEAVLSPDGSRVAVIVGPPGPGAQLWVKELPTGPMTRLTDDPGYTRRPVWSVDGERVTYITDDSVTGAWHVRSIAADGSSLEPEIVYQAERPALEATYTPDGASLLLRLDGVDSGGADLAYLDLQTGQLDTLLASPYNEYAPTLSPDGRWMAYVSEVTGSPQVFVRPFGSVGGSAAGSRTQISAGDAACCPVWSPMGDEIFYSETGPNGVLWVADFDASGDAFRVTSRQELFPVANRVHAPNTNWRYHDTSTDGRELLMIGLAGFTAGSSPAAETPGRYILVQNWFTELERLLESARSR